MATIKTQQEYEDLEVLFEKYMREGIKMDKIIKDTKQKEKRAQNEQLQRVSR